jgi:recombination protein RecA
MGKDVLDRTLALLQKKFGEHTAVRMGAGAAHNSKVTCVIPTGIEVLDHYVLGDVRGKPLGGLPCGRVSELYGGFASGKTSLAYAALASCQRDGGTAVMVDAEYEFDEGRAELFGVNLDDLLLLQPRNLEMALEQIKMVVGAHDPKRGHMLIAYDSLASSKTAAGMERVAGKRGVGDVPLIMSEEFPKIMALLGPKLAHLLLLNQVRANIGVLFGDNTTTAGGNAPKFYASHRLQILGGKAIKDSKTNRHLGKIITVMCSKSRFSEPYRKARVRLNYAEGWDNEYTTVEHAKTMGLLPGRDARGKAVRGHKAHALALHKLGWPGGAVVAGKAKENGEEQE